MFDLFKTVDDGRTVLFSLGQTKDNNKYNGQSTIEKYKDSRNEDRLPYERIKDTWGDVTLGSLVLCLFGRCGSNQQEGTNRTIAGHRRKSKNEQVKTQ